MPKTSPSLRSLRLQTRPVVVCRHTPTCRRLPQHPSPSSSAATPQPVVVCRNTPARRRLPPHPSSSSSAATPQPVVVDHKQVQLYLAFALQLRLFIALPFSEEGLELFLGWIW